MFQSGVLVDPLRALVAESPSLCINEDVDIEDSEVSSASVTLPTIRYAIENKSGRNVLTVSDPPGQVDDGFVMGCPRTDRPGRFQRCGLSQDWLRFRHRWVTRPDPEADVRIFIAGATGAIGRRLTRLLLIAGHQVVGTTRTATKADSLRTAGVTPVVLDGLDPEAVHNAVVSAQPEVVIHQLTALSGPFNPRNFDGSFAQTNRLRTEGTDHLLKAAIDVGARRFVAQSFSGWPNSRSGGAVKDEADPLDSSPTAASRQTLAAIAYLEHAVTRSSGIEGLVMRYGTLYGSGTSLGKGGQVLELVSDRKLPIVGTGSGIWSFVHADDAAVATAQAVASGPGGLYNIVDDEPALVSEWLPYLAKTIAAKAPLRLPTWIVRPMIGEHGVSLMTQIRGSSNAKANGNSNGSSGIQAGGKGSELDCEHSGPGRALNYFIRPSWLALARSWAMWMCPACSAHDWGVEWYSVSSILGSAPSPGKVTMNSSLSRKAASWSAVVRLRQLMSKSRS